MSDDEVPAGPGFLTDPRWRNDVVLADGTTAVVRPIAPDDGPALLAFHERQSRESIYFRFFSPRPRLSDADVARLTNVDGVDRMAFVATRDDSLLGVARYDRYPGTASAEVAFFTDDEMGGRGIATLLLEYLVAYARDVGIDRFDAHVLPENRRMLRVFTQAGFGARSEFADGVIEVAFDIEPNEEAAAAMARRARRAERQSVARLLEPEVVAVVGASREAGGLGHQVLRNLLATPFRGIVHPVHPEAASVAGIKAHPRIGDVPDPVDLAIVSVPAAEVPRIIEDCGRARVGAAIVISAGFAESGPEGRRLQDEVLATARRFGVRLLGPNCLGAVNTDPRVGLVATFADLQARPGPVGLLSQSGTLGAVIVDRARALGLGFSNVVAVGNKADLSGNDLLQYWIDDDRTEVVLLYLESFGNPRRFGVNVRAVARRKPVFAVRSGAALDALTGAQDDGWLDDSTIDGLLRQTGVIRVPTVHALLDAGRVAASQPVPAGDGVVVIGNSGGSSSMAADACVAGGLRIVGLAETTTGRIDEQRLHGRPVTNPVDLPYDATPEDYEAVLDATLLDPEVDTALVVHAPYLAEEPGPFAAMLDRVSATHPDVTIVAAVYGPHPPVTNAGVPVFDFPDDAALALGRYVRYASWLRGEGAGEVLVLERADAVAAAAADALVRRGPGRVGPDQARTLLAVGGIETVPIHTVVDDTGIADPVVERFLADGPVALKSVNRQPGARTQAYGVALDLHDPDDVRDAATGIAAGLGDDAWPLVLQPMVASGADVRISIRTHPIVGPVVTVGPGGGAGRFSEPPRRALPLTDLAAVELVDDSGLDEVLDPVARGQLVDLVGRLAAFVDAAAPVAELTCDPVIVRADRADIVDVDLVLAEPGPPPPPDVRRL